MRLKYLIPTIAAGLISVSGPVRADSDIATLSAAQKTEFELLIRDYLLRNPEVLVEAMEVLKERQRVAAEEATRKALTANRKEIFEDPNSPVGGNPDGDVVMVEFFDYHCGVCRRVHPVLNELMARDRNIKRIFKEWPILGPESQLAARAALASRRQGQDKYLAFHKLLMTAPGRFTEKTVSHLAERAGIDAAQLTKDMNRPEIANTLARNFKLAEALGINGTPSFVIGNRLIRGGRDLPTMQRLIAEARAGKTGQE